MIHFQCDHCAARFKVPEAHAGKAGRCPKCRKRIVVPKTEAQGSKTGDQAPKTQDIGPMPPSLMPPAPSGAESFNEASPDLPRSPANQSPPLWSAAIYAIIGGYRGLIVAHLSGRFYWRSRERLDWRI